MAQADTVNKNSTQTPIKPDNVTVGGFWGKLLKESHKHWMMNVSDDLLLSGFRSRPGAQPWIGEHIGKYLMAVIPSSELLQSKELKDKIRRLVEELVTCQEPDGYLGTYLPKDRWLPYNKTGDNWRVSLGWDVWVFKYAMLALLSYYDHTNWKPALEASAKAADLLIQEFRLDRRDINDTDPNTGLGSGSVLEPIMLLYQRTNESRYLEFARHILARWEQGHGLMRVLRERGDVCSIGNGKAYEMMSCFVGLLEYARMTGENDKLQMVVDARDRIADSQRYPTGGMSVTECFWREGLFPEWASMETCVTFTWIQLNLRIFELTGDERALDLVEEASWNQLLPALSPEADTWSYHLSMIGPKRFFKKWVQGISNKDHGFTGAPVTCCHTNGQRGLALVPTYVYSVMEQGGLAVNFFGESKAECTLPKVGVVKIEQRTDFPCSGKIEIQVTPAQTGEYELLLRKPMWAEMLVDGQKVNGAGRRVSVQRIGKATISVQFLMKPRIVFVGREMRGKCAIAYGPLIMALDKPPEGLELDQVALMLGEGNT